MPTEVAVEKLVGKAYDGELSAEASFVLTGAEPEFRGRFALRQGGFEASRANALAVVPALETARLARAGVTTQSYGMLAPVLDEATASVDPETEEQIRGEHRVFDDLLVPRYAKAFA